MRRRGAGQGRGAWSVRDPRSLDRRRRGRAGRHPVPEHAPLRDAHVRSVRIGFEIDRRGRHDKRDGHEKPAAAKDAIGGKSIDAASSPTAQQLLDRARDGRAVWDDFPGFSADLTLWTGGKKSACRITVTGDGEVQLRGCEGVDTSGVQILLDSLVQHRLGGGGPQQAVVFVNEPGEHPLGRMIRFEGDTAMHSAYRVKDDMVTEVNRRMGDSRFTISVLDADHNAEGKYLPTTIQVSYWDAASGAEKQRDALYALEARRQIRPARAADRRSRRQGPMRGDGAGFRRPQAAGPGAGELAEVSACGEPLRLPSALAGEGRGVRGPTISCHQALSLRSERKASNAID